MILEGVVEIYITLKWHERMFLDTIVALEARHELTNLRFNLIVWRAVPEADIKPLLGIMVAVCVCDLYTVIDVV